MINTERKTIQGDDPEYNNRSNEILSKIADGVIDNYIVFALDEGDVGVIINLEKLDLESEVKLHHSLSCVVAELRMRIDSRMLEVYEKDKASREFAVFLMEKMSNKSSGNNQKEEGGAE